MILPPKNISTSPIHTQLIYLRSSVFSTGVPAIIVLLSLPCRALNDVRLGMSVRYSAYESMVLQVYRLLKNMQIKKPIFFSKTEKKRYDLKSKPSD